MLSILRRYTSSSSQATLTAMEKLVINKLQGALQPKELSVRDISGGCGSMFSIFVKSDKFTGLNTIKQHRLVNEILEEEIKQWHGLQLTTKVK